MKEKEARVDLNEHTMSVYVEKDDGSYGAIQTGSFMVKDYMDDYVAKFRKINMKHFQRLLDGEFSPVGYYMALRDMTPEDTASRVRVSSRAVHKHMDLNFFGTMSLDIARRYADVFGIALPELFCVVSTESGHIKYESTKNPWIQTVTAKGGQQ